MNDNVFLPEGFRKQGEYIVTDAFGDWCVIWKAEKVNLALPRFGSEGRKAYALAFEEGEAYLTPKGGRPGWNVRKTFPRREAIERKLPFVLVTPNGSFHFSTRGSTVKKVSETA